MIVYASVYTSITRITYCYTYRLSQVYLVSLVGIQIYSSTSKYNIKYIMLYFMHYSIVFIYTLCTHLYIVV